MADTVVVTVPETEDKTPVEVETETTSDNVATVASDVAESVADAVVDGIVAHENTRATDHVLDAERFNDLSSRLDVLTSNVAALAAIAATPEPEPEPEEETVVEDDEIVPNRKHPWFRSFSEMRGDR